MNLEEDLQKILSKYGYRAFFELLENDKVRKEKITKIRENLKKIKQK